MVIDAVIREVTQSQDGKSRAVAHPFGLPPEDWYYFTFPNRDMLQPGEHVQIRIDVEGDK